MPRLWALTCTTYPSKPGSTVGSRAKRRLTSWLGFYSVCGKLRKSKTRSTQPTSYQPWTRSKTMIGIVSICLVDHLNPGFGYQIRIIDDRGQTVLFTSRDPLTGQDLLTLADCLRVAQNYAPLEQE